MVVARFTHGQLVILDRLREMVRLGAGLDADGRIDRRVAARAQACLERFGQRLRDMRPDSVRVVGTNALRIARHKDAFMARAREALGHPIEIVSGMEEARLIYRNMAGVAHGYLDVRLQLCGFVPSDQALARAAEIGRSVLDTEPDAPATHAFRRLAECVLARRTPSAALGARPGAKSGALP